jgi:hypothetical protein
VSGVKMRPRLGGRFAPDDLGKIVIEAQERRAEARGKRISNR